MASFVVVVAVVTFVGVRGGSLFLVMGLCCCRRTIERLMRGTWFWPVDSGKDVGTLHSLLFLEVCVVVKG